MIRSTYTNLYLKEHHVYRLGSLLVEAIYRRGWRLMVVNEDGFHVMQQQGALVAFELRDDGLWDTLYDQITRRFLGWKRWGTVYGAPVKIGLNMLEHFADSRFAIKDAYQTREIDQKFRAIMADMEW